MKNLIEDDVIGFCVEIGNYNCKRIVKDIKILFHL